MTVTFFNWSLSADLDKNSTRFVLGSSNEKRKSLLTIAKGSPGKPAPEPTSITRIP